MATLNINGRRVTVDDSFKNLSPEEQNATVEEIASSLGVNTPAPSSGIGDRLKHAVDGPLEGFANFAQSVGAPGTAQALRDAVQPASPSASSEFVQEGNLNALPGAAVEQAGQFAGSVGSRAAGAATGAAIGSVVPVVGTAAGAAIGAFAGPALFEGMQTFGSTALARAKENGREEPDASDYLAALGTASVSGALNAVAPGATGIFKRALLEGGTEALQSAVQAVGSTAGTEGGLKLDPAQAAREGVLGGVSAPVVDVPTKAVKATAKGVAKGADAVNRTLGNAVSRTDEITKPEEIHAAERLEAIGGEAGFGNVTEIEDANVSDKGRAKAALQQVRAEARYLAQGMKQLAKSDNIFGVAPNITALVNNSTDMNSAVPESEIDALRKALPDQAPQVEKLAQLAREAGVLQRFTSGRGDMGGLTKQTSKFDITDSRRDRSSIAPAILGHLSLGATTAINRGARVVDNMTNRRSSVKRLVDSAMASELPAPRVEATDPYKILADRKAQEQARVQANREAQKAASLKTRADKAALQAKEEADRVAARERLFALNQQNFQHMVDTGKADRGVPFQEPYAIWEEYTGLGPRETHAALVQLETEGAIPQGTTQKWVQDIRSFPTDSSDAGKTTYALQEAIRNRFNPKHKRKPSPQAQQVLAKLVPASALKTGVDESKFRQQNGQRISKNVSSLIENNKDALTTDQYKTLKALHHKIDSFKVTRKQRQALVDKVIPKTFESDPDMGTYWRKAFTDLAQAGNDFVPKVEDKATPKKVIQGLVLDQYGKPIT